MDGSECPSAKCVVKLKLLSVVINTLQNKLSSGVAYERAFRDASYT